MSAWTRMTFGAPSCFFFPFIFNSSYRVSSHPKSVPVGNVNVYGHKYPVFLSYSHYLHSLMDVSMFYLFIFHSWDSIFEGVPRKCKLFPLFWKKFCSAWSERAVCKLHFQQLLHLFFFSVWSFSAIWFHSLMKIVGKDVPPLSLFKHLTRRKSLWEIYVSLWALSYVLPLQL